MYKFYKLLVYIDIESHSAIKLWYSWSVLYAYSIVRCVVCIPCRFSLFVKPPILTIGLGSNYSVDHFWLMSFRLIPKSGSKVLCKHSNLIR